MELYTIDAGLFKLDGGAMFGVVPKSFWNKLNPADNNNLCTWMMRCLLIHDQNRLTLIDTGMGSKQDPKWLSYYYRHGEGDLVQSIRKAGFLKMTLPMLSYRICILTIVEVLFNGITIKLSTK